LEKLSSFFLAAAIFLEGASWASSNSIPIREASETCKTHNPSNVYRIENIICMKGEIKASLRDDFFKLSPRQGDIIVASGPGGDIAAAMDIGDFIYNHDLPVVIDDLCGSSCAYFIALGGRRLAFYGDGLLGFHGGPIPVEDIMKIPNLTDQDRKKVLCDNKRFKEFFQKRGLNIIITYEAPEESRGDGTDWKTSMWVRWPDELKEFGFKGVVSCSGNYCKKN
jgi:hypothetical protein